MRKRSVAGPHTRQYGPISPGCGWFGAGYPNAARVNFMPPYVGGGGYVPMSNYHMPMGFGRWAP